MSAVAIPKQAAAAVKRSSRKTMYRHLMTDMDEFPQARASVDGAAAAKRSSNGNGGEPARRTSAGKRTHSTAGAISMTERLQPSVPMRIGGGRVKKARVPFDPSVEPISRRRRTTLGGELSSEPSVPPPPPPPQSKPKAQQQQPLPTTATAADPSDQQPQRKRRSLNHEPPTPIASSPPLGNCGLCLPSDAAVVDGRPHSVCTQCKFNRVHVECYRSQNSEHYSRKEATSWQCDECLTCTNCYESTIIGPIYKCYSCFSNYHAECNMLSGRIVQPTHIVQHNRFRCAHCLHYEPPLVRTTITLQPKVGATVAAVATTATAAAAQKSRIIKRKPLVTGFLGFVANDLRTVRCQSELADAENAVGEDISDQQPELQVDNAEAESAAIDIAEPPTPQPEIVDLDSQSEGEADEADAPAAVVAAAPSPLAPSTFPMEVVDLTPDNVEPDIYEVVDIEDDDVDEETSASIPNSNVQVVDDILTIDADRVRPTRTTAELIGQLIDSQISVRSSLPISPEERAPIDRALQRQADAAAAAAAEASIIASAVAAYASDTAADAADGAFPATVITSNHDICNFKFRATLTSTEPWSPYGRCASDIVPDASDWSIDDVHEYFAKCLPAAADVLREEEVDGCALLLLKRTDVLELPGISMGARLNVYTHCVRLQTRSNDVRKAYA